MLLAPLAATAVPEPAASGKMTLCVHQNTSRGAGFRKSLEGWARAGIKNVELTDVLLDEFLKTEDLGAAGRVVTDLGLTVVSCAAIVRDLWVPNPGRPALVDTWKKRVEQFSSLGSAHVYCPASTTRKVTADDYKAAPDLIHEAGDI